MREAISEILSSYELLWQLAYRDLRIRYKQTLLGVAWAIFSPVLMMILFTQIFARLARIDHGDVPYPVFVYAGLLPWQFFATSLKGAMESLTRNSRLVTKIYMPREVFPMAQIVSGFIDFLIAGVVLAVLMAWYGVAPGWTIVFLPIVVLTQILFTIGLSLLLAMGNLFYRDVKYIFEVALTLWMFATSVVYPIRLEGPWATALALNPMTPIIDAYRNVLLENRLPDAAAFTYVVVLSCGLSAFALWWFHESEHLFAENI